MVVGRSPDGSQRWLNWVLRRRVDGRAVGTLQATLYEGTPDQQGVIAEVAWVVAAPYQGRGYASEAAQTMLTWLREQDVTTVVAHVHPEHAASRGVARAIGLTETTTVVDGETRWHRSLVQGSRSACNAARISGWLNQPGFSPRPYRSTTAKGGHSAGGHGVSWRKQ